MERSINTAKLLEDIRILYGTYTMFDTDTAKEITYLRDIIRKFELTDIIKNNDTVCVAGMQGTGKTTLIKNLYGLDDNILRISNERGEQVPVFIRESSKITGKNYEALRYYIDDKSKIKKTAIDVNEVSILSRRKDDTICIELYVPKKFFISDTGAFCLLPGFEKSSMESMDENYNSMLECCLSFSKAVLFVTDAQNIANSDIDILISQLQDIGFKGSNSAFAITKCDSNTDEKFELQVKESLKKVLKDDGFSISDSKIVCCGEYFDKEKNELWKERLIDAINSNAIEPLYDKKRTYFQPLIDEILDVVEEFEAELNKKHNETKYIDSECPIYSQLKEEIDKGRNALEKYINENVIPQAAYITDKNVEATWSNMDPKLFKEKKFLFIKKSLATINENNSIIQDNLSECSKARDGRSVFQNELVNNFSTKQLYKSNFDCLNDSNYNDFYMLSGSSSEELVEQAKNNRDVDTLVASYFTTEIMVPEDESGKPIAKETDEIVELIAKTYNTYYIQYYIESNKMTEEKRNFEADKLKKIIGASKSSRRNNRLSNSSKAGAVLPVIDLLDGSPDLLKGAASAIKFLAGTPAAPYIAAAAGVASVLGCGVVANNKNVSLAVASQNAAKQAIKSSMEEQRDKILDAYDEGGENMLKMIDRVHRAKNNIGEIQTRINNAKYAINDIRMICQESYDDYANSLKERN